MSKHKYREMDLEQLKKALVEARKQYFALRIRKKSNELENISVIRGVRRNIARILTEVNKNLRGNRG